MERLPSNDRVDTYTDTQTDELRCDEYIPSFIRIGPEIQKLIRGIHRHTFRMEVA
jgi:hypothetical protein